MRLCSLLASVHGLLDMKTSQLLQLLPSRAGSETAFMKHIAIPSDVTFYFKSAGGVLREAKAIAALAARLGSLAHWGLHCSSVGATRLTRLGEGALPRPPHAHTSTQSFLCTTRIGALGDEQFKP